MNEYVEYHFIINKNSVPQVRLLATTSFLYLSWSIASSLDIWPIHMAFPIPFH